MYFILLEAAASILTIIDMPPKIIKIIRQTEIDEVQGRNLKSVQDPKIVDNEFNVSIDIPSVMHTHDSGR
jgi:hypothetical protein